MSHKSLDRTDCLFSRLVGSGAQVRMAGHLPAITIRDGPAECSSRGLVLPLLEHEKWCGRSRQCSAGAGLRAKSACSGTHRQLWLRPKRQPPNPPERFLLATPQCNSVCTSSALGQWTGRGVAAGLRLHGDDSRSASDMTHQRLFELSTRPLCRKSRHAGMVAATSHHHRSRAIY